MNIKYLRTLWGMNVFNKENKPNRRLLNNLKKKGYQGFEIAVQFSSENELEQFKKIKTGSDFTYVAQIHTCGYPISSSKVEDHLDSLKQGLETALKINPDSINVHSGRDCWSFEQTLEFFSQAQEIQKQINIPIQHETHRQRALYNPYITQKVIENCPEILLNADLSHWVVVGERLYSKDGDKEFFEAFNAIKSNVRQIHARIGSQNQIQVLDPSVEKECLDWYDEQWRDIIQTQEQKGTKQFFITCEFGPVPYSIIHPKTKRQINDIIKSNDFMLNHLINNHK